MTNMVVSQDGTRIAYDVLGDGPAVILVEGATGYRASGFSPALAGLLASHFKVFSYDRRGRGESTDTQPFAVQREIEDIEALIEAAGGSAYVYGMSSGACLALEAAVALGDKIKKLAIYEPPYNSDEGAQAPWMSLSAGVGQPDRSKIAEATRWRCSCGLVGAPDEMIQGMRQGPEWAKLEGDRPDACL